MPAQAPAQRRQAQEAQGGGFTMTKLMIGAAFYFGVNFFLNWVNQKSQTGVTVTDANGNKIVIPSNTGDIPAYELRPAKLDEGATFSLVPEKVAPIWPQDSYIDIIVTLSPSDNPQPVAKTPEEYIVLREENFHMNNYSDKRTIDTKFTVPKDVQNNGTLWGHFYIGLHGATLDPKQPNFDPGKAFHFAHPLTQYLPKKKVSKTRNLLEAKSELEVPEEEVPAGPVMANYYHPNASFSIVPNSGVQEISTMPPILGHFLNFESTHARDSTGKNGWYYPVLFVNTFWQLTTHMTLLNDTVKELPLHIDLDNIALWKFTLLGNIESNSKENARKAAFGNPVPGTGDGTEIEMVKEIFIDTNPILLAITAVVSVAHVILETLAFGSDIAHYRKKKDNVGISVRSILANIFMQAVILLYLVDNSQNTSWMILGGQAVGIVIEFWKITTVVDVKVKPTPAGSILPYWIYFEDKKQLTETEEKTKEYDEIAFKYMYMLAVPLLVAYGIYSLIYDSHKSWYSFVITTLVGSVYTYGFLMMIPSLYINYRLKSVAHMPARAMMYKFLNTFIDDLFAFTIKMPLLHRLATFRDDLIFFVYLYQHFNYKTDYTRVNEFGQGGDDDDDAAAAAKAEGEAKKVTADDVKKIEEKVGEEAKASGADVGAATKRK